jgi:hypothetical protein
MSSTSCASFTSCFKRAGQQSVAPAPPVDLEAYYEHYLQRVNNDYHATHPNAPDIDCWREHVVRLGAILVEPRLPGMREDTRDGLQFYYTKYRSLLQDHACNKR